MAYKLTPEQYKDVAEKRIENKNTAENTNSAVSAYARALDASRASDNKNKQSATIRTEEATGGFFLRSLSTVLAPVARLSEGVAKFVENSILDASAGLTASFLDIVGADNAADNVQDFVAKDIIGDAFDWRPIEQIYQNSYSNDWGKFGDILQEGLYSVGQQAVPFALTFFAGPWVSAAAFALGSYGGGFEEASQDGGDVLGSSAYGLVSAALETLIEGTGGSMKWGKALGKMDDIALRLAKSGKVTSALSKIAVDSVQEGKEEVISGLLNNYIRAMTYRADTSSVNAYFENIMNADPATAAELLEQFILGATAGAMMGGVGKAVSKISPTVGMSESIQELDDLREKGYNLNQRGKDTIWIEEEISKNETSLMEKVNANFDKLAERKANGNSRANAILGYMEQNFDTDENGRFVASKNVLVKNNDNVSYGVTEREIESVIAQQGNQIHQGVIEGEAAETKSVIQRTVAGYNNTLGRNNPSSRLKLVFADIADNADGTRSYGYVKDGVVVIDARALTETVEFSVLQGDKTQTYSVNAAMSTLLHEVFHFTEDTKSGQELRRILGQYAADNTVKIEGVVESVKAIDGESAAQAKRQELDPADLVSQTEQAYSDKSMAEQVSELSARQLENLLFNERVIRRLTEDNSTLAKRILNNAKRLWDAVKGAKIAATKELETLINKTVKLYNKAIAEVGSGKYLTSDSQTEYSKRTFSFQYKNFPGEKETGSEAHRLAVWWANQPDVKAGDRTLISMNNRWYLVERFDDADNHYQVEDRIPKKEYDKINEEIKANGRSGKILSIQRALTNYNKFDKLNNPLERGESSIDSIKTQFNRENTEVGRLDSFEVAGRERIDGDGSGNRKGGGSNRQGDDVKHSRRLVSNKGMSRSIDDTIQMLSVLEGVEETHQVKVSKEKLIENYVAEINHQSINGKLKEDSPVVKKLVDSIIDTAVMEEYQDDAYLAEHVQTVDVLRKYFHSMNLAPIKSDIQAKYGKTNGIFMLWGKEAQGRSWDTVVQEIVEEMPQLAVEGDSSGMATLYNIFDAYKQSSEAVKSKKVEAKSALKNTDEVKRMMAKQFVASLQENSTELVTKASAENMKKQAVKMTAENLKSKIAEIVNKSRASLYSEYRMEEVATHIKKDLSASELKELRNTEAYKDLAKQIYDKYANGGKAVSLKSIQETETTRLLSLKKEINSIRNITRMNTDNRERLNAMKALEPKKLLGQLATYKDSTFTDAYNALQKSLKGLYKKTSDGKDYLKSYNEMLEKGVLLDTVNAFDKYLAEENPALDFSVATGDFAVSKEWVKTYIGYLDSIKGMKYTDMTTQEKSVFSDLLNRFLGTVTNNTTAERQFEIRGETYSARSYIDKAKAVKEAMLKLNSDGTPQMPRKGAKKFLTKTFFKTWARPKTIITYMEEFQYGKDRAMGGLLGAYTALEDGAIKAENTKNFYQKKLYEFVDGKGDYKGRKSIRNRLSKGTITVNHSKGTIKLTVSEAVSLYKTLTQKDNELNYDANDSLAGGIDFVGEDGSKYRFGRGLKFTEENISELYNSFKKEDLEYIEFLEKMIEELGVNEKAPTDIYKFGNARLKENYWPSHVAGYEKDGKLGDKNGWYNPADPVENLSIVQRRERNKKTLIVKDSFDEMVGYINSVSMYSGIAIPLENFNIIYNLRSADGLSYGALLNQTGMFDYDSYLKKLLLDIQGAKSTDGLMRGVLKKLRSNYARSVLSFNPKTPIVQLSAFPMLLSGAKDASALYGIARAGKEISKKQRERMYEYCPAVRARFEGGQAYRAEGNLDNNLGGVIGKISDAGMKGIEAVDFITVSAAWETFCKEVGAVGDDSNNPELLKKAGWLLANFLDSIDRFDTTARNEISRSENPLVNQLAMFHSSQIGMFDSLCRTGGFAVQRKYEKQNLPKMISMKKAEIGSLEAELDSKLKANERAKSVGNKPMMDRTSDEVKAIKDKIRRARLGLQYLIERNNTIDKDVKAANHWAKKTVCAALVAMAAEAALGAIIVDLLNGEEEEDENKLLTFFSDVFGNMLSLLPGVGMLYNSLEFEIGDFEKKGYDAELWLYSMVNDAMGAFNSMSSSMNGDKAFDASMRDTIFAVGKMFGVPTKNFHKILDITTRAISPSANYKFNSIFGAGQYSSDLAKAVEAGDTELAETITRLMMKDTFGDSDTRVISTIRKLYEQGYTGVLPRTVSNSVTIDGTRYEMTRKQQQQFKAIYSQADETIENLVGKQSFVKLSPQIQADSIKWIYDYYYNRAKEDLSGADLGDGRKAMFATYLDVGTLAVAYGYCRSLEADTDKKGKVINGTRKAKVVSYIQSLRISAAEKYMLLGYLGYSPVNANAKTLITNYARQQGASKSEIAELLEACSIAA